MNLFKYCSSHGSAIFETRTIWFSQPEFLNDPFELNPSTKFKEADRKHLDGVVATGYLKEFKGLGVPFKAFKERVDEVIAEVIPKRKEEGQRELIAALNERFSLLCLSGTDASLPMWAHYAEQYKGFVIRFESDHEFFNPKNGNHIVRKVNYKAERPWVGLDDKIDEAQEVLYTKSSDWGYEQEFRLVRQIRHGKQVKTNSGAPAYAFDLPPSAITGVAFGCRATKELIAKVTQTLSHKDFKHVDICSANIDAEHYALETLVMRAGKNGQAA